MSKTYVDLSVVAHLFYTQNVLEKEHRDRHYKDPSEHEKVRLEVQSTLYHLFSKILSVVEMSHPMTEYEKKQLLDKADMRPCVNSAQHYILK